MQSIFDKLKQKAVVCVHLFLISALFWASAPIAAKQTVGDTIEATNGYWSSGGTAAQDGAFTAVSSSMIAWGIGGVVAIAIITALFAHDSGSSSHN